VAEEGRSDHYPVELWEVDLLRKVASRFRTSDRDELEAELARKLLVLKSKTPTMIRNWRAYLAKFFFIKASNWIRDERARTYRHAVLADETDDDANPAGMRVAEKSNTPPELAPAFAAVWDQLSPAHRSLWTVMVEENGNQVRAARRLNKRRNTVRAWTRQIQQVLIAHGLQPEFLKSRRCDNSGNATRPDRLPNPVVERQTFVVLSERLLQALPALGLSGTQWRVLLWVIRHTNRRKQKTIPCRWSTIARALSLNRSSALRAGRTLLGRQILCMNNSRIGVRRDFGSPSGGEEIADKSRR
jgi:hypothetical protein